jgi:hypothetical protein
VRLEHLLSREDVVAAAKFGCKTTGIRNRIDWLFAVKVSLDLVL